MARKSRAVSPARTPSPRAPLTSEALATAVGSQAGPSTALQDPAASNLSNDLQRDAAAQKAAVHAMSASRPHNPLKSSEFGRAAGHAPSAGEPIASRSPLAGASTVSESATGAKVGSVAPPGSNPQDLPLDRVRVDNTGQALTTDQGIPIADNQNSLKAGLRGPSLLEDFVLREKLTHFDHERIPERVVHARGSGAHGYFECTKGLSRLTRAAPFAKTGKRTPVFVRFSTVAGERGSSDLARDVRGFAVKFYTEEGNWDLVGNNIPVFFVQDAMKFPDLVHAVKPEPHHGMPQAASAHDTFWDFASLMPEITHMLMWVMSDRAIPRSYRTMQGFGVHTFRLVNASGESVFCKFHFNPAAGTHSVVWDEAVKISGADPDFHRRDLWEAIESGNFPEWELGLQIFTEEQAAQYRFDVLDATKIVPEELAAVIPIGRLVLNRNPDNFFAETEQVAFCTANLIPGIDTSNDPLLQGRHHSYLDTQLSRLGGPNFHEIPINGSIAPVHNHHRDGLHRQAIPRGRVAYEPNTLGGGCPFQSGMRGFRSFPEPVREDKVRAKPEKFADHYSQATLFWNSQSAVEKQHIVDAFRFELTRVQVQPIRERIVSMLANVSEDLAQAVAEGLGMPAPSPMPLALPKKFESEVAESPSLSLMARPGQTGIRTRRVALIVADGVDGERLRAVYQALAAEGAVPRYVGLRLGTVQPRNGPPIHVEVSVEAMPSALWDACVIPDGEDAAASLGAAPEVKEFLTDQYRHCKPILCLDPGHRLLGHIGLLDSMERAGGSDGIVMAGAPEAGPSKRAGAPRAGKSAAPYIRAFIGALSAHRHYGREKALQPK